MINSFLYIIHDTLNIYVKVLSAHAGQKQYTGINESSVVCGLLHNLCLCSMLILYSSLHKGSDKYHSYKGSLMCCIQKDMQRTNQWIHSAALYTSWYQTHKSAQIVLLCSEEDKFMLKHVTYFTVTGKTILTYIMIEKCILCRHMQARGHLFR
jgi:hypothetical protein